MKIIYNKEEAVNLLLQQELVVIFQGHSEWGARALGNRSMLFDPRNLEARNIVNKIKVVLKIILHIYSYIYSK